LSYLVIFCFSIDPNFQTQQKNHSMLLVRVLLSLCLATSAVVVVVVAAETTCGNGTFLSISGPEPECLCLADLPDHPNEIRIGGIFDTTTYDWGPALFQATVQLINERKIDALASPEQSLVYSLANAKCDETQAARAYWTIRTENNNKPPHGLIGARCSGASITLARLSGLEGVPQLSAASNVATLSDTDQFPFFSRLVAPNNEAGEVGALIAMLRAFDWEQITILATDTQFAQGFATEFKKLWNGPHDDGWFGKVYSDSIRVQPDGLIDQNSVQQVLEGIPVNDPSVNSRIILLVAHVEHAFAILEKAERSNFQPDTIWVGTSSWIGRSDPNTTFSWLSDRPGYLGVSLLRNRDAAYQSFMNDFNTILRANGQELWDELPPFAAEHVDGIVAMTKALAIAPDRRDGSAIVQSLRQLDFDGVSGRVQFTEQGDRQNPIFSIFNVQSAAVENDIVWTEVGIARAAIGAAEFTGDVCFALGKCGDFSVAPPDTYPEIDDPLPWWLIALLVFFALALLYVSYRYKRSKDKKRAMKEELETFRKSVVGMRTAGSNYIPTFTQVSSSDGTEDIEQPILPAPHLPAPQPTAALWCWQEHPSYMDRHSPSEVHGDPNFCWIKYDRTSTDVLESVFQLKEPSCSPLAGYEVHFATMLQTNLKTGFDRNVIRVPQYDDNKVESSNIEIDYSSAQVGMLLPDKLKGEPQMVLVDGDVVQISTQREDGWSFGTKVCIRCGLNMYKSSCHE
jgi:hypothetical protein